MFTRARIKLTIVYTLILVALLWLFSLVVYASLGRSLAGDRALAHLFALLVLLDAGSLVLAVVVGWLLAGWTLAPIEQAHEQQTRFVSNASHELRTPLAVLLAELDIALTSERTGPYYHGVLERNREEISRLAVLANNLLTLARTESSAALGRGEADLAEVIARSATKFQARARQQGLALTASLPEENLVLPANQALLEELVDNLVDNAIKFSPAGGTVSIAAARRGRQARIVVQDQGSGMTGEEQTRIWEPFYQVDAARGEGFGLGLAICRTIVQWHHGTIAVDSTPGNGSTFTIALPRQ
ncbi:MAG: sensor histidine kinase [Dehalococcoidia bacterium]